MPSCYKDREEVQPKERSHVAEKGTYSQYHLVQSQQQQQNLDQLGYDQGPAHESRPEIPHEDDAKDGEVDGDVL